MTDARYATVSAIAIAAWSTAFGAALGDWAGVWSVWWPGIIAGASLNLYMIIDLARRER